MEPNVKDKKEYELGYLLKEEKNAEILDAVRTLGGDITLEGPVNRTKLAYEIQKESEAYFGFVQFMMEPTKAKELEAILGLNKNVMRSLIMTPPPMKEKKRPEGSEAPKPAAPVREAKAQPTTLSNEALEKKIEEILQ
jgi:small subunit ribosomal protein S6